MERPISFAIEKELPTSLARAGVIRTPHGPIETPAFVAVGTKASVKGLEPRVLEELGVSAIIANAYHLYLSGLEAVKQAGGVGAFMGWSGPTMTDSGGFQVFSLGVGFGKKISKFEPDAQGSDALRSDLESLERRLDLEHPMRPPRPTLYNEDLATSHGKLAIIDDDGVTFTSHLDGSLHRFTPERSVEIQHALGADIIFAFDECTAPGAEYDYQREAMDRTHRWAARSLSAHRGGEIDRLRQGSRAPKQGIYGIVQGGRFADLREGSAQALAAMDFDGYGIGGSFSKRDILGILDRVNAVLPKEKPRHLLGIGEPEDLFVGVAAGIDTFDCVLPTRNGRTGTLYTARGKINIGAAQYRDDFTPLDAECGCFVCRNHTRAYLHHLFRSRELLAPILASAHNVHFLVALAHRIRISILDKTFGTFRDDFLQNYLAK